MHVHVPGSGLYSLCLDSWSLFILSLDDVSKPEFSQFGIVICKYVLEFLFVNTMVGTLEAETSVWNKMENIRIILVKKLFAKSAAKFFVT